MSEHNPLFDFKKLKKDLNAANRGEKTPGLMVEGRNTDMTGEEIENKIAEDGIKETLGSNEESDRKLDLSGLKDAATAGMGAEARAKTKFGADVGMPRDVMAARRNALINILKG